MLGVGTHTSDLTPKSVAAPSIRLHHEDPTALCCSHGLSLRLLLKANGLYPPYGRGCGFLAEQASSGSSSEWQQGEGSPQWVLLECDVGAKCVSVHLKGASLMPIYWASVAQWKS